MHSFTWKQAKFAFTVQFCHMVNTIKNYISRQSISMIDFARITNIGCQTRRKKEMYNEHDPNFV